jgi:iron complex transport system ATP-binding protein
VAPLLEARGVVAGYRGRRVLEGVDMRVSAGELWAVLGPNGAGKSTLVRAALGLLPLQGGTIALEGRSLASYERRELARRLAWVPQASDPSVGFTGLELVLMGRSPHLGRWGLPAAADVERARVVLDELEVGHLGGRLASELSGGERRLLLLARALVQAPRLLFLDEPTAFLDLKHQVTALERVRARVEQGMAAVAVLHDVNLATAFADRVLLLRQGRVLAQGEVAEVLAGNALERLFDLPMAVAVLDSGQRIFAPRLGR